ncbi:MAG: hypothetical protein WDW36_009451 [Sanguina aurantia]
MSCGLVVAEVLIALAVTYINGFHDTANSIATVVATKVLSPGQAVLLAAVTNLLGAMLGTAVAATIASGLINAGVINVGPELVICALVSAIVWNLITWWLGLPSSSSHALVGALVGAALATSDNNVSSVIWAQGNLMTGHGVIPKVIIPMVLSPKISQDRVFRPDGRVVCAAGLVCASGITGCTAPGARRSSTAFSGKAAGIVSATEDGSSAPRHATTPMTHAWRCRIIASTMAWHLGRCGYEVHVFDAASGPEPLHDGSGAAAFSSAGMLGPSAELDRAEPAVAALGWQSIALWEEIAAALPTDDALTGVFARGCLARRGSVLLAHRGDEGAGSAFCRARREPRFIPPSTGWRQQIWLHWNPPCNGRDRHGGSMVKHRSTRR